MERAQKPSNPLEDPDLPARFSRLIIKHMIRLRLSDKQLVQRLRNIGGTRGSLASVSRHKDGSGGRPTTQTIGLYAEALDFDPEELEALLYANEARATAQPSAADFQDQWRELIAELQRQSNLPYEVEQQRAKAKAALAEEDFARARRYLTAVADATRRTAEHATEEFARSLASLGALAFTEADFAEACAQYGAAMVLPGLSEERVARYRRSYLVASNAVAARSGSEAEARAILAEMRDNGVTPNEISVTTAVKKASSFEEALGMIDFCLENRGFVGRGSFEAAYSFPIAHLSADETLREYHARKFKFDTALEGPINQYWKAGKLDQALQLLITAPHVGASQKLYRKDYEVCRAFFERELENGNDGDNLYYGYGIAAALNKDHPTAVAMLQIARERSYAPKRTEHIDRLLAGLADGDAASPLYS